MPVSRTVHSMPPHRRIGAEGAICPAMNLGHRRKLIDRDHQDQLAGPLPLSDAESFPSQGRDPRDKLGRRDEVIPRHLHRPVQPPAPNPWPLQGAGRGPGIARLLPDHGRVRAPECGTTWMGGTGDSHPERRRYPLSPGSRAGFPTLAVVADGSSVRRQRLPGCDVDLPSTPTR